MKNFFYFGMGMILVVFFAGCSVHRLPVGSSHWVNPDTGRNYLLGDTSDLSEEPIECRLPQEEKPTLVYSEKLCEQLIREKKILINQRAMSKNRPQRNFSSGYYRGGGRDQSMVSSAMSHKQACDKIKFQNTKIWCSECRNSLADNIYCGMNGQYYPPPSHRRRRW